MAPKIEKRPDRMGGDSMRRSLWPTTMAGAGFGIALLLAGCGKSGGGATAIDVNAPVIANLRASFGGGCTLRGQAGRVEVAAVDYIDADGDLRGGTVEDITTPDVGEPITLTGPIPSLGVTITGTTSGTVTQTFCVHFGRVTSFTEMVRVADASGKISNELSVTVSRPAGAPLMPRGIDNPGGFMRSLGP